MKLASTTLLAAICVGTAAPAIAGAMVPDVSIVSQALTYPEPGVLAQQTAPATPERLAKSYLGAQWIAAFSLLGGAIATIAGIDGYLKRQKWQRRELARSTVEDFACREAIRNVAQILDYEEYRYFEVTLSTGQIVQFEATDDRLKRALRSHDQMVKTHQGLKILGQANAQTGKMSDMTAQVFERYRDEEFVIELALRDWFDQFLGALEACNNAINAGIVTAEDIRPFIIYWIQVIGDRRFRRKGGSGFYDSLFHYIYWAGYTGVQELFERYGYKILPPPYSTHDFADIEKEDPVREAFRALCMGKAAHLVYEDQEYVEDIVRYWLSEDVDNVWQKQNPADYAVDMIKHWISEGVTEHVSDIREDFRYLVDRVTDTQAFMFRKGPHIILIFRGSQQFADWKTNFKFRLQKFAVAATPQTDAIPTGEVHRGFQEAWESVEKRVVIQLKKWWTPDKYFWITGHSLGGALASLAAISLEYQGFKVNGLYTFGQPRVGDWKFTRQVNVRMCNRMFRYVNNNDVVPMVPPQFNVLNPTRLYGHMGQFRYFDARGKLQKKSFISQRWGDRLIGFLLSLRQPGADFVADHAMEFYVRYLQRALDDEKDRFRTRQEKAMEAMELFALQRTR
ncbi:MAG: lipase family protein [Cyanobacteria bacterium J06559_3]